MGNSKLDYNKLTEEEGSNTRLLSYFGLVRLIVINVTKLCLTHTWMKK